MRRQYLYLVVHVEADKGVVDDADEEEAVEEGVEVGGKLPQATTPVIGRPGGVLGIPVDQLRDQLDVEDDVGDDEIGEDDVDHGDATLEAEDGQDEEDIDDKRDGDEEGEDNPEDDHLHRLLNSILKGVVTNNEEGQCVI